MSVKTALIVDDSRVARLAIARRLGARGIEVVSVASGADALRKLQDIHPDVIFMDYMMPEMDGLEACRAIVNNPSTSSIPVIMTTSNDTPEFRKRGVSSGARGFLSKGLEDRELDNVLDLATDSRQEQETKGVKSMASGAVELDEKILSMIRDQAINAARKASEEYFTGQLPGLEEQVIQVAENAARQAVANQSNGNSSHSKPAPVVNDQPLIALKNKLDNIHNDSQLRSVIQKMIREEGGGKRVSRGSDSEPPAKSHSGFGRFLRNLIIFIILLAIAYAVIVLGFSESPLAIKLQELVSMILERAQSNM